MSGCRRRGGIVLAAFLAVAPAMAMAHAAERVVIQTLPTQWYMLAAALAVAATVLLLPVVRVLPGFRGHLLWTRRRLVPEDLPGWCGTLGWTLMVLCGFLGPRDPFENALVLWVWTGFWIALPLASALLGDLWHPVNPWRAPVRWLRGRLGWQGGIGLSRLGHWPAVASYLGFAWFEIVSLHPADPAVLARVVALYGLAILALAVAEGEDWLERGEAFSLYFSLVARIAPLWAEPLPGGRIRRMAGLPGSRILELPPLPVSGLAFVTLILAGVTFDGLSETFRWLAWIGINPLDFPGRSAVRGVNTAGLLACWAMMTGAALGCVWAGLRLGGDRGRRPFLAAASPWILSLLPISAGYHIAHYLVALLTQGQYAVLALNDPLGLGWSLLGLDDHWVSFGRLADRDAVLTIWTVQFAIILGAHVLAVVLAMRLSEPAAAPAEAEPSRRAPALRAGLAHLPVTTLMVILTVLGLWLLSAPTGA